MEATTGHPLARDLAWSNAESTKLTLLPLSVGQTSISELARACVERERSLREQTNAIQRQIDDEVYRLYGISDEDRQLVEVELGKPPESETEETAEATELANGEDATPTGLMPPEEHIRRLIHYLAHQAFRADSDGVVPQLDTYTADGHLERGLAHRVRQQLGEIFGEAALPGVELDLQTSLGKSLDDWLATDFFAYHVGLYRFRPLVWQITSKPRGEAAYSCFVYWHSLDDDTLRKIQEIYLRPTVEGGMRAANLAAMRLSERRASHAPLRELREAERDHQQAEQRHQELQGLVEKIQCLLQPQQLTVASRSAWVSEKVNEIVARGYRPNRDYGVRVNIEPLKQAGIMPAAADRVKG
ncbi:MAG: hypothetical protein M1343_12440 [Chloroflexi bacterium]|nr:hypothetical protein [Chloroflexota bacterium]MDA8187556.1 hypothetical protein [Dehalococcoidales bacterium]